MFKYTTNNSNGTVQIEHCTRVPRVLFKYRYLVSFASVARTCCNCTAKCTKLCTFVQSRCFYRMLLQWKVCYHFERIEVLFFKENLCIFSSHVITLWNMRRLVLFDPGPRAPNDVEERQNKSHDINFLLRADLLHALCVHIVANLEQRAKHVGDRLGRTFASSDVSLQYQEESKLRDNLAGTIYGHGADSDLLLLLRHVSRVPDITFMRPINCSQSRSAESG